MNIWTWLKSLFKKERKWMVIKTEVPFKMTVKTENSEEDTGMYSFSKASLKQLETAHPYLQELFNEVIRHVNCTVLEGHRNEEDQNKYFNEGKSKVKWPNGNHNKLPSLAVDVAPYPIDWSGKPKNLARFYFLAGFVQGVAAEMRIKIRWGGDWNSNHDFTDQNFDDLPHFELVLDDKEVA